MINHFCKQYSHLCYLQNIFSDYIIFCENFLLHIFKEMKV